MPDEDKAPAPPGGTDAPPPAPGGQQAPPPPPGGPETDYASELRKRNQENESLRKRLKAAEEADAQRETDKLSELERANKRATDLEGQLTIRQAEIRNTRLESLVTRLAHTPELNIVDAEAALRLMDQAAVEWAEDKPDPTSVEKALKALVAARPYLVRTAAPPPATGGAGTNPARQGGPALTIEQIKKMSQSEVLARLPEIQRVLAGGK